MTARKVDVMVRSPDAEFILEGDETTATWTEETKPLSWFRVDGGKTVSYYADNDMDAQDEERVAKVNYWADKTGGIAKAIHSSPILALDDGTVLDGTHRLVAALRAGLRAVTVLVMQGQPVSASSAKKLYRGVGKNTGKSVWGPGRYLTDNRELAQRYGEVEEHETDAGPLWNGDADFSGDMLVRLIDHVADKKLEDEIRFQMKLKLTTYQHLANALADAMKQKAGDTGFGYRRWLEPARALLNDFLKARGFSGIEYPASNIEVGTDGKAYVLFASSVASAKYLNDECMVCLVCKNSLTAQGLVKNTKHLYTIGIQYACPCKKSQVWSNSVRDEHKLLAFFEGKNHPAYGVPSYTNGFCNDKFDGLKYNELRVSGSTNIDGYEQRADIFKNADMEVGYFSNLEDPGGDESVKQLTEQYRRFKPDLERLAKKRG